jgi:hypothetical protein
MAKKANIKATLKEAGNVEKVWKENPSFVMADMKLDDYITFCAATEALDKDCAQRDIELTGLKVVRDDKVRQLHSLVTRFRSGMISHYGADSAQYEQAGGTRTSVRKSRTRKARLDSEPKTASA